jgi:aspartyl-tRNA(Asn)/glutamyl-tRNA(Gln) amidotransferase subunit C
VSRITRTEVEHVARLARLTLPEGELAVITGQLDRILDYVAQLGKLDTSDVEPTSHVVAVEARMRSDVAHDGLPVEDALANTPDRKGNFFRVPKIIE